MSICWINSLGLTGSCAELPRENSEIKQQTAEPNVNTWNTWAELLAHERITVLYWGLVRLQVSLQVLLHDARCQCCSLKSVYTELQLFQRNVFLRFSTLLEVFVRFMFIMIISITALCKDTNIRTTHWTQATNCFIMFDCDDDTQYWSLIGPEQHQYDTLPDLHPDMVHYQKSDWCFVFKHYII